MGHCSGKLPLRHKPASIKEAGFIAPPKILIQSPAGTLRRPHPVPCIGIPVHDRKGKQTPVAVKRGGPVSGARIHLFMRSRLAS